MAVWLTDVSDFGRHPHSRLSFYLSSYQLKVPVLLKVAGSEIITGKNW